MLLDDTDPPAVFVPPLWVTVPTTTNESFASTSVSFKSTSPLLLPVEVPDTADAPLATVKVPSRWIYPVSLVTVGASFTPIIVIVINAVAVEEPSVIV